jgi:exosortase K
VKTKFVVAAVVALVSFALKRHYADASTDALSWILTPTAHLVGLVTGVTFTAVPGEGYFSAERMFLIEKACAGVNFMIAAFAMVAFALLHRARSVRDGAAILGISLAVSYLAAVVVNTTRIVIAMWLAAHPAQWLSLTAAELHRLEGITVYFGGLWLLYALVQWIDRGGAAFKYALPVGCYYLVTLGLPLVNAGRASDAFLAHGAIVLLVPPVLILLVYAVRGQILILAGRQKSRSDPPVHPRRKVSAGSSEHARFAGSHAAAAATTIIAKAPNV